MSTKTNASAKVVKTTTKSTSPSKSSKKDAKLGKLNLAVNASATKQRDSKYIYPKDCTTKSQRKEFRRKARQTGSAFEKQIKSLKASNEKAAKKELDKIMKEQKNWQASTLVK